MKRLVAGAVEGRIQVVVALAPARGTEQPAQVETLALDDGRDRIVEVERVTDPLAQRRSERLRGQRSGRQHHVTWGKLAHLFAPHLDERMLFQSLRNRAREGVTVDGERRA